MKLKHGKEYHPLALVSILEESIFDRRHEILTELAR